MKKSRLATLCILIIIFLLELFLIANYLLVNIEIKQEKILVSLVGSDKLTLEEQFNNRDVVYKINELSESINYSKYTKSIFVKKNKKRVIKNNKNKIQNFLNVSFVKLS